MPQTIRRHALIYPTRNIFAYWTSTFELSPPKWSKVRVLLWGGADQILTRITLLKAVLPGALINIAADVLLPNWYQTHPRCIVPGINAAHLQVLPIKAFIGSADSSCRKCFNAIETSPDVINCNKDQISLMTNTHNQVQFLPYSVLSIHLDHSLHINSKLERWRTLVSNKLLKYTRDPLCSLTFRCQNCLFSFFLFFWHFSLLAFYLNILFNCFDILIFLFYNYLYRYCIVLIFLFGFIYIYFYLSFHCLITYGEEIMIIKITCLIVNQ